MSHPDEDQGQGCAAIISLILLILIGAFVATTLTRLSETDERLRKLEARK